MSGADQPTVDEGSGRHAEATRDPAAPSTADALEAVAIDGFELLSTLGSGGFGVVFRARDRAADREVALKLLRSDDPGLTARFQREGQAAAALNHPGILAIHGAGTHEGRAWLSYELVADCRTLDEAFAEADLRQRVSWVRDAAEALGAAHAAGVLHRDVKPANLLVDGAGRLRVADFGLALLQDAERLTQTGVVLGTLAYAAPEQLRDPKRVGPAADVYSLGVVLFEALTGVHPLPLDVAPALQMQFALAGQLPRPRQREASVPLELDRICARTLALEPEARYADGAELAQALDAWLAGPPPSSRPERLVAATAGFALVILMALALGLERAARRSTAAASPTAEPTAAPSSPPRARAPAWSTPLAGSLCDARLADLDGDGAADAVLLAAGSQLSARALGDGALRWTVAASRPITAGPATSAAPPHTWIAVGDAGGELSCWTADGRLRWRRPLGGSVASVLVSRSKLGPAEVIGAADRALVGFDERGATKWTFKGWRPSVHRDATGARMLLVRREGSIRVFHLGMVGDRIPYRLFAYHGKRIGAPLLAELDDDPGLEVVVPQPGQIRCVSLTTRQAWHLRVPDEAEAPTLVLRPRARRPAEVFVVTARDTLRLDVEGRVRERFVGFRLHVALPDGDLLGVQGDDLVRRDVQGRVRWAQPRAPREPIRVGPWGAEQALLVRAADADLVLDLADGEPLLRAPGRSRWATLAPAATLLRVEGDRLQAWR